MDILGIGNAMLDIFWFSDDESALALGLHPNYATHVSPERLDELLLAVPFPVYVAGGTASNAVKAAAALGGDCTFIGCTGTEDREEDRWGRIFSADMASYGVHCQIENRNTASGRCLVIHMPGGLKSIACAPAAAATLRQAQISDRLIPEAKLVFLDGQVLKNAEVTDRISTLCKEYGIPLAIDVASQEIAQCFSDRILKLITNNDIFLFMNTDEALTLALALEHTIPGDGGLQSPEDFINFVFSFYAQRKGIFPCIVEKRGVNGARAWMSGAVYESKAETLAAPLDDTGAGDVFDGAFLEAWIHKLSFAQTLDFSNSVAHETLQTPGTRLDWDRFSEFEEELSAGYSQPINTATMS